jgi:hypothetical protein
LIIPSLKNTDAAGGLFIRSADAWALGDCIATQRLYQKMKPEIQEYWGAAA